ncbi:MAG: C1 family peptidase [Candidatus Eisenbacteria bacterium]
MRTTRNLSLPAALLASVGVLLAILVLSAPALARVEREITPEEEARLAEIRAEIARNGYGWIADHTSVSGLSPDEKERRKGFIMTPEMEEWEANAVPDPEIERMEFRDSFDWRDFDGVTPAKDQLDCGSCWAFAAASAVEAHIRIYEGVLLDISEQQAIDCNTAGSGCDGGTCIIGFSVFKDPGAVSEACYPYMAEDGNCRQGTCDVVGMVDGYSNVVNTVSTIKYAVENYGPVVTSVHVYEDFYSYSGGCYEHAGSDQTDHTVLILGWDDTMCGTGAWLIKNSWGQDWGLNGFGWMKYGTCRIGTATSRPLNAHVPHDRLVPDEFGTIQLALDNANRGDVVKVAGGTYHETVTVPDYVQLYGGYDPTFTVRDPALYPTIIDADQGGHGINVSERDYIVIDGFEVEDAGGTSYYGIYLKNSEVKVRNCVVRDSWRGIGVVEGTTAVADVDAVIEYCTVKNNTGAGIYVNNADNPNVVIQYTAIYGNGAEGVYSSQSPTHVMNCTIVDNGLDGGVEMVSSSGNIIKDNIIVSNAGYGVTCTSATPTVTYNDVWGNTTGSYNGCTGGAGSISDDPVFCDAGSSNYAVHASSPTVGAAQYGYNMGALGIGCPLGPQNLSVVQNGASLDLSWDIPPAARADVDYYIVYRDTTQIPLTQLATVAAPTTTFTDITIPSCATYNYWVSAVELGGLEGAPSNKSFGELCYTGPSGVGVVYVEGANEISWTQGAGPIDRYDIYRSTDVSAADSVGTVSYTESFFVDDTSDDCPREKYGYEVLPVYDTGWTGVVSERTIIDPLAAPPSGIVGQWVTDDIELTWDPNCESDFRSYWVYRDTMPISPPVDPGIWIGVTTDTLYLDENLNTSKVYFYRITTTDASQDQSEYSEMVWVGSGSVLTVPSPYGTIQAAINAASALDTVLVAPGTYSENIVLKDGVRVASTGGRATTTISSASSPVVNSVALSDITVLSGFTIDGLGSAGIGLDSWASYVAVEDCAFQNCTKGANFQYGGSPTVSGCTFAGNQYGAAVGDSASPFFSANTFDGNSVAGVSVGGDPGPEIGRTLADANDFINMGIFQVFNTGTATVDADHNWWDDLCPDVAWFYGSVDYTPWTDAAHTGSYTECTGVPDEEMADRAYVSYNYPNPFNPSTAIRYSVPSPGGLVRLTVYDLTGREVKTLVSEQKRAGDYLAVWYGKDDRGNELGSGVYFYRLEVGEFRFERKMVMLK